MGAFCAISQGQAEVRGLQRSRNPTGQCVFRASRCGATLPSVITLTTVGYGDFSPVTPLGKIMAMLDIFLGVGIISSLPSPKPNSNERAHPMTNNPITNDQGQVTNDQLEKTLPRF